MHAFEKSKIWCPYQLAKTDGHSKIEDWGADAHGGVE